MSEEDFKSNFVTANIDKPLAELQELNNLVKRKKAEVRKAMFYQKHPDLLLAKKDYEEKIAAVNTEKFNEALTDKVKEVKVKEEVKEVAAPAPAPAPTPAPAPAPAPAVKATIALPQHAHKPFSVGLNSKWL